MLAGIMFWFFRVLEITTLIPVLGMLAYFVNGYANNNQLTPNYILVLFIVSVLAAVWALVTLIRRKSTRRSAHFVAFIDLCFVGALIAGVYELRDISSANCNNVNGGFGTFTSGNSITINYTPFSVSGDKTCNMLKASFAFGIMNIIFFCMTSLFAGLLHRHEQSVVEEKETYRRRSHDSRRGHSSSGRRRSSSRRRYVV